MTQVWHLANLTIPQQLAADPKGVFYVNMYRNAVAVVRVTLL